MNNQARSSNNQLHPFDLEERTSKFGEEIIKLVKTLPLNDITRPLINQIVKSGTSIGANYMESDGAESKKDFKHCLARCKKESKETRHWLRMLAVAVPEKKSALRNLWREADELTRIFSSILRK